MVCCEASPATELEVGGETASDVAIGAGPWTRLVGATTGWTRNATASSKPDAITAIPIGSRSALLGLTIDPKLTPKGDAFPVAGYSREYASSRNVPPGHEPATPPSPPRLDGDEEPTRVLIVEDHRVVAEGLAALINHQADMKVVGTVGTVAECIPGAKMIFLTREDTDAARFAAVQSGASAFLHKSKAATEVVAAIRDVARGKMLITPRTIATLLSKRRSIEAQLKRFTPREKEVLKLMAEGYPSRVIAAELGISYTTIRTHIRSLGSKLAVHSKLEAIVKARELGLIN